MKKKICLYIVLSSFPIMFSFIPKTNINFCVTFIFLSAAATLSLLMITQEDSVVNVQQDQTAQNVQSDL